MDPHLVFNVVNLLPLPIWAIWIVAPGSRPARYLTQALWPWAVLAAIYGAFIVASGFEPARDTSFGSLSGVMAIFDGPWSTLAGWTHYLVFDAFVGRWMVLDAPRAGYRLAPFLVLTLMLGPLGFLAYVLLRPWLRGRSVDAEATAAP